MASEPARKLQVIPERGLLAGRAGFPLALVPAVLTAFGILAVIAARNVVQPWDRALFRALYSGESPAGFGIAPRDSALLDSVLPLAERLTDTRLLAGGCALLMLVCAWRRAPRDAAFVALAILPMAPASRILEQVFGRASPYPTDGVGAFPSGHAMVSMAIASVAVALARGAPARRLVAGGGAVFVTGVGVAVVADGGHWPSDVFGGWLLAVAWVVAVHAGLSPRRASRSRALSLLAHRPMRRHVRRRATATRAGRGAGRGRAR